MKLCKFFHIFHDDGLANCRVRNIQTLIPFHRPAPGKGCTSQDRWTGPGTWNVVMWYVCLVPCLNQYYYITFITRVFARGKGEICSIKGSNTSWICGIRNLKVNLNPRCFQQWMTTKKDDINNRLPQTKKTSREHKLHFWRHIKCKMTEKMIPP